MNGPTRFVALALLLTAIACSGDNAPASAPSLPSTGGGTTTTPAPSPPTPSPPPTGGGGATPAFAGQATSATDGSGAAFNRS